MNYYLLDICINGVAPDGSGVFLPLEDNGTPEWAVYKDWLAEGNTPLPAPEPEPAPVLTTEQKLEAAGLTVAELKELFGLT
jgi:hypothetical protein